jgi:hypothetical protein
MCRAALEAVSAPFQALLGIDNKTVALQQTSAAFQDGIF